jgi:Asp-tRNA(Asn)/Glu-tRNA(Gln) amidotransferase A subunit family amidase
MPVAVQLIGRPFGEARLLGIGARIADALGWTMRPGLPPQGGIR